MCRMNMHEGQPHIFISWYQTAITQSTDVEERMSVIKLLGNLFAHEDSNLIAEHRSLWNSYLGRYGSFQLVRLMWRNLCQGNTLADTAEIPGLGAVTNRAANATNIVALATKSSMAVAKLWPHFTQTWSPGECSTPEYGFLLCSHLDFESAVAAQHDSRAIFHSFLVFVLWEFQFYMWWASSDVLSLI